MRRIQGTVVLKRMTMVLAAAALSIGVAAAADAPPAAKNPCSDDVAKYCKDVKPGGGRIALCLKENEKQLSPACKASIEESRKQMKAAHQVCDGDIQKFCKDVAPGEGRIVRCLREHEKDLSTECRTKLTEPKRR